MYYALIGDMIGSKCWTPRERRMVQERLWNELDYLNGRFGEDGVGEKRKGDRFILESDQWAENRESRENTRGGREEEMLTEIADSVVRPASFLRSAFLITLGDEFQALFEAEGDPLIEILKIAHEMRPYEFRFAIGCGDIYTEIDPNAAIGADGPAYHNSRRLIEGMKKDKGARIRTALGDPELEKTLNTVLALCDKLKDGWTEKQERLVYCMLLDKVYGEKKTQKYYADVLGVGQGSINLRLKTAGFDEYFDGIELVRSKLARYMTGEEQINVR